MLKSLLCLFFLLLAVPAQGLEIEGVNIPDSIDSGLQLNGAGIRSKFFFNIYIAELYLEKPSQNADEILSSKQRKRMVMHILYNEVSSEKLVDGWNDGFEKNLTTDERQALAPRIEAFNEMFTNVNKGETIVLDYSPGKGTEVTIAGKLKGSIAGADFNWGLLSIWLGPNPVSDDLRDELLGSK